MSDNKKYYYLKLKDNFYDSDEIKILEEMENGYKYTTLLLKLYLRSLKNEGALRLNEFIPYDNKMIAAVTNMDIDTVRVSMEVFKKLKLIEILEDGTIYLLNIQNYIGESSTEADRVRDYRKVIELKKHTEIPQNAESVQMYDKCTPELELELEIKKELDINISVDRPPSQKFIIPTLEEVKIYCNERNNNIDANIFIDFYTSKGWMIGKNKMKDWQSAIRTWERKNKDNPPQQQKQQYKQAANDNKRQYKANDLEKMLLGR